ncbi:MAG: hypothetical protein IKI64_04095 [Clostridia bacterium]|nr:hypothetical protein [Clostridia bacterium]
MKKKDTLLLIGFILVAVGIVMFFKCTRVQSWGFYRFGTGISTGGIVIALILLDVILYVATQSRIAKLLFPILIALLVLLLILGTRLSFHGTLLDMFLMLVPAAVGAGLLIKALITKN